MSFKDGPSFKLSFKLILAVHTIANSVKNEDLQFLNGTFNDI